MQPLKIQNQTIAYASEKLYSLGLSKEFLHLMMIERDVQYPSRLDIEKSRLFSLSNFF